VLELMIAFNLKTICYYLQAKLDSNEYARKTKDKKIKLILFEKRQRNEFIYYRENIFI